MLRLLYVRLVPVSIVVGECGARGLIQVPIFLPVYAGHVNCSKLLLLPAYVAQSDCSVLLLLSLYLAHMACY